MTSNDPAESTSAAASARLAESIGSMLAATTPDVSMMMGGTRLAERIGSMLAATTPDVSMMMGGTRLAESLGSMLAATTPDVSKLMGGTRLTESLGSMLASGGLRDALTLMPESFPTSQWSGLDQSEIEAFAQSLRDTADEEILAEAEALYTRVLGPERPPTIPLDSLELTLPFEPDPYVRATLQLISVLSVWTVLFVVGSYAASIPILSGALYALGAPVPSVVWKASGKALERLYGKGNYSPPRQSPTKGRKTGKGIW